jgi:cell division protein FtsB
MAALAFLVVYFTIQALTGERGLLSSAHRQQAMIANAAELKRLHAERLELEARTRLLRDGSLSRDLLEERSRTLLGLTDPRDFVIRTGGGASR